MDAIGYNIDMRAGQFSLRRVFLWLTCTALVLGGLVALAHFQTNTIRETRRQAVREGRIPLDDDNRSLFTEAELRQIEGELSRKP